MAQRKRSKNSQKAFPGNIVGIAMTPPPDPAIMRPANALKLTRPWMECEIVVNMPTQPVGAALASGRAAGQKAVWRRAGNTEIL